MKRDPGDGATAVGRTMRVVGTRDGGRRESDLRESGEGRWVVVSSGLVLLPSVARSDWLDARAQSLGRIGALEM